MGKLVVRIGDAVWQGSVNGFRIHTGLSDAQFTGDAHIDIDPEPGTGEPFLAADASVMQDDLLGLLRALGLGDHARPYSPHEVMMREVLPEVRRVRRELDNAGDAGGVPSATAFPALAPKEWDAARPEMKDEYRDLPVIRKVLPGGDRVGGVTCICEHHRFLFPEGLDRHLLEMHDGFIDVSDRVAVVRAIWLARMRSDT